MYTSAALWQLELDQQVLDTGMRWGQIRVEHTEADQLEPNLVVLPMQVAGRRSVETAEILGESDTSVPAEDLQRELQ